MKIEELLNAGMAAAKAKDAVKAIKLLTEVVQTDPNSELGWLWLGLCVSIPERRDYCFRTVLRINPNNTEAIRSSFWSGQLSIHERTPKRLLRLLSQFSKRNRDESRNCSRGLVLAL